MRRVYEELMRHPEHIEATLQRGAAKARGIATPFTARLRHAVGLRALNDGAVGTTAAPATKLAPPQFKQYREKDGLFYFQLTSAKGEVLLQSEAYAQPREAAQTIKQLISAEMSWTELPPACQIGNDVDIEAALQQMRQSQAD